MTDKLRNPKVETAFTKADVQPGASFITYIPGDRVVQTGMFTSEPTYDGESDDRWTAEARVKLGSELVDRTIYLFDAGITPDETGERWSKQVTIPDDAESQN